MKYFNGFFIYTNVKHIKYINEGFNEDYYTEISYNECEILVGETNQNLLKITDKELTKIKSLYNQNIIKFDGFQFETIIKKIDYSNHLIICLGSNTYHNMKFESYVYQNIAKIDDDWYILYHGGIGRVLRYYKCDQLEGLLKCMKDHKMTYPI